MSYQHQQQQQSLETLVGSLIAPYEERMLLDIAADLFQDHCVQGVIRRQDIAAVLPPGFAPAAALKVFHQFDADRSGSLDAQEFLQLVRYLNFGNGYCDGCDAPITSDNDGFLCTTCNNGYILCGACYTRAWTLHTPRHEFTKMTRVKKNSPGGLPGSVGQYLRSHIEQLFTAMDTDRSGAVTTSEFVAYYVAQGYSPSLVLMLLQFDLDGDGFLSRRELLFLVVALATLRTCDECGALVFIGKAPMACCTECTADYDVCGACVSAHRVTHPHKNYRQVSLFDLRHAGLCYIYSGYGANWTLVVADAARWQLYQPFVQSELCLSVPVRA